MRYLLYIFSSLFWFYGHHNTIQSSENILSGQITSIKFAALIESEFTKKPIIKFIPRPNEVYLCCRGTKQKQGMIAREFNFSDTNITHIGIGFTTKEGFKIFHVSNTKKAGRYFCREGVSDFISEKGTLYFSAWKMEASPAILKSIIHSCLEERNNKIIFDTHFSGDNGDTLYCSEFCRNILIKSGFDCAFPLKTTALPGEFYKLYFGADSLRYVPVDFFLYCKYLKKDFESFFSEKQAD